MSRAPDDSDQVRLDHSSASLAFWTVLSSVCSEFDSLRGVVLGSAAHFRRDYAQVVPHFELARQSSPDRGAITRRISDLVFEQFSFSGRPLLKQLELPAAPLELQRCHGAGPAGPSLRVDARAYTLDTLQQLGQTLLGGGKLTPAGFAALQAGLECGRPDSLSGQSFVVLGAAAELAPTRELLARGARVLWVDRSPPRPTHIAEHSGQLWFAPAGMDLLAQPNQILSTVRSFSQQRPVHVGCYAYAAGNAREWRLAATMAALVERLAPQLLRSASLLYSPASPSPVAAGDAAAAHQRRAGLARFGAASPLSPASGGPPFISNTIVDVQGASYQAAQYLSKRIWMDALIERHSAIGCGAAMAGISLTESMNHPAFQLAFSKASSLGVAVYEPEVSRQLCALMMLGRLGSARSTEEPQLHGGIHRLPYSLSHALKRALALALARRPWRLSALLR